MTKRPHGIPHARCTLRRVPALIVAIALAMGGAVMAASGSSRAHADAVNATALGRRVPLEDLVPAGPIASDPHRRFLVCPVARPRHYVDDFGDPRWVGGFHRHQGIDIFAPAGTPI